MIKDLDNITNEFISRQETKKYNFTKPKDMINYNDYFKNNSSLKSYKIPELKGIAKHYGLHVTGTKPVLIERITTHFTKMKNAVKIQAFFRGHFVRISMNLRGPALKNRQICVNDKDFVTMEPLSEIPLENFYSYMDSNNFTYGFDISSIIQSMKQKSRFENPYNRERISNVIIDNIKKLYRLCFVIFPEFKNANEKLAVPQPQRTRTHINSQAFMNNFNEGQQNRIRQLNENRTQPLQQRIVNLFLELDQLGNYTNANWFNLSTANYVRLYRHLYDIWYLRSQLTRETRHNICPLPTPFSSERNIIMDLEYIKTACVEVFENLIFTGVDEEHRRLGAFHALTALTIVSMEARQSMPWLYESVAVW
jgi:hypothetical protein